MPSSPFKNYLPNEFKAYLLNSNFERPVSVIQNRHMLNASLRYVCKSAGNNYKV
jgi:hypothetical protein